MGSKVLLSAAFSLLVAWPTLSGDTFLFFTQVPAPDTYRGKYRDNEYSLTELTDLYVKEVKDVIESLRTQGRSPAAFIAESMQSCGGQVIYPPQYLSRVKK